jgi:hypothetical protein
MLLKLLLPAHPRIVGGGWVGRWHVKEGDWVDYGDDLFDLTVREGLGMRLASAVGMANHVRELIQAQEALADLSDGEVMAGKDNPADFQVKGRVNWFVRVSASDGGRLRRLCAGPGERREVGDVLALLTTEADEPVEEAGPAVARASVFRTVVTLTPLWGDGA